MSLRSALKYSDSVRAAGLFQSCWEGNCVNISLQLKKSRNEKINVTSPLRLEKSCRSNSGDINAQECVISKDFIMTEIVPLALWSEIWRCVQGCFLFRGASQSESKQHSAPLHPLHRFAVLPGFTNTNAITRWLEWSRGEARGGRPNSRALISFRRWTWYWL